MDNPNEVPLGSFRVGAVLSAHAGHGTWYNVVLKSVDPRRAEATFRSVITKRIITRKFTAFRPAL